MSPALKHNPEGDELSQKVPLGENFAWWVFRRKNAAANDCCIREKQEVKLRLVSGERFPGQYYDQETGLYYNYYRYYDPETGRYITSDPIGLRGGLNTYLYADASPAVVTDPFGLAPKGINTRNRGIMRGAADLIDSTACQWWPASCLWKCVRWRCWYLDECGKKRYHLIGQGYPYYSNIGYDPNKDEKCECVKEVINPD